MDPITQTLCGAIVAQALFNKKLWRSAVIFGAIGGELPDIDVVFDYGDRILNMVMHRHFTHSLLFIPICGLIAALPLLLRANWRSKWKLALGAALVGSATHGLIDCCTSYGTYLLWPFSDMRISWDIISIIDPVFTLPLLLAVAWALARGSTRPAWIGFIYALSYLSLGVVQHARVVNVQQILAEQRGHVIERSRAMPTFANQIIWRSLYEVDGKFYADAVRVPLFGKAKVKRGESIKRFEIGDLAEPLGNDEYVRSSFERFAHFSDDYLALIPSETDDPLHIGDMRYSYGPEKFSPIWGLALSMGNPELTAWSTSFSGDRYRSLGQLWDEIVDGEGYEVIERHMDVK